VIYSSTKINFPDTSLQAFSPQLCDTPQNKLIPIYRRIMDWKILHNNLPKSTTEVAGKEEVGLAFNTSSTEETQTITHVSPTNYLLSCNQSPMESMPKHKGMLKDGSRKPDHSNYLILSPRPLNPSPPDQSRVIGSGSPPELQILYKANTNPLL
jgi:hypothetical protein